MIFGGMLILLGVFGFVLTGSEHYTALIPAYAGIAFVLLGGLALNPNRRMHAMHAAVLIGLLGFFGTIPGVVKAIRWIGGTVPARPPATISQAIMCGLCLIFVALCVNSFIQVRRNRSKLSQSSPPNQLS